MKIYDICPQFDDYITEVVANLEAAGETVNEADVAVDILYDFGQFPEGANIHDVERMVSEAVDENQRARVDRYYPLEVE